MSSCLEKGEQHGSPHGMQVGDKTFKVHLDGYNFSPFFKGEVA